MLLSFVQTRTNPGVVGVEVVEVVEVEEVEVEEVEEEEKEEERGRGEERYKKQNARLS